MLIGEEDGAIAVEDRSNTARQRSKASTAANRRSSDSAIYETTVGTMHRPLIDTDENNSHSSNKKGDTGNESNSTNNGNSNNNSRGFLDLIKSLVMIMFECVVGTVVATYAKSAEVLTHFASSASSSHVVSQDDASSSMSQHAYQCLSTDEDDDADADIESPRTARQSMTVGFDVGHVSEDEFGGHQLILPPSSQDGANSVLFPDVAIEEEPESALKSAPFVLTRAMMQQLMDKGLPTTVGMKRWKRLYSVRRDGDSFGTFLNNVRGHKYTLIVLKTMKHNEILGAFVDTEWERGHGGVDGHQSFYGTGQSFLFKVDSKTKNVSVFKWTGVNNYNQLCYVDTTMLALGGGGRGANFGLCVQDSFSKGTSGSCDTYGNPSSLASEELFDILRFEVYGFVNHW